MRVRCVGAIVHDQAGRLLLIRRGHPPGQGRWSLPGGRVEPEETDEQALRREVYEETGLAVEVGPLLGSVERAGPDGAVYDIKDYEATAAAGPGMLTPGDDAADARWVTGQEMAELTLTAGLLDALASWDATPRM